MPLLRLFARVYCYQCLPGALEAIQHGAIPRFEAAGPAKIAALRADGNDPTTTPESPRRRVARALAQRKAIAAWRDDGSLDGVDFPRDILPKLQRLPVRLTAKAMSASTSHGSKVRVGDVHAGPWAEAASTDNLCGLLVHLCLGDSSEPPYDVHIFGAHSFERGKVEPFDDSFSFCVRSGPLDYCGTTRFLRRHVPSRTRWHAAAKRYLADS